MQSWILWVQRPSGLIKMEGRASAFRVANISWKLILIIDLNCYHLNSYSIFTWLDSLDAVTTNDINLICCCSIQGAKVSAICYKI